MNRPSINYVQTIHHRGLSVDIWWNSFTRRYAGKLGFSRAPEIAQPSREDFRFQTVNDVLKSYGVPVGAAS